MLHFIYWTLLPCIGTFVFGGFVAWNNPKKKINNLLDQEITKAAHAGKADILNLLTVIKSKL